MSKPQSRPKVRVSDHALVRFMERVGGADVSAIRNAIARSVDEAAQLGARAVIIDGFRYVFREDEFGPLVTTVEPHNPDTPIRRSGRRFQEAEE